MNSDKHNKSISDQSPSALDQEDVGISASPTDIAKEVIALLKDSFQPNHQFIRADHSSFEGIDPEFYNQRQARFEELGFAWLCDLEDKTISDQGRIVTFSRTMRNAASNVLTSFYYIPVLESGFFECESLLSDGRFVVSTTMPESNKIADWPVIVSHHYPINIDEETLYQSHLCDVLHACDEGVSILEINSFEAVVESQNALNRYKYEYLQSIGWVTREYLLNQCYGDEQLAEKVYVIIQQMKL
jgi:hypothetical protein